MDKPVSEFSFIDENTAWALRITFDPDISDYVYRTVNGGVGINEQSESKDELSIFPNPANHMLTLSFELSQKENISISVRNISGQEIMQIPVCSLKDGNYELNCSDFALGIYFVTLKTDSSIFTEKLIIK